MVLASILGWGLAVLGSLTEVRNGSALAQLITFSLSPAIFASFAWWFLLSPKAGQENNMVHDACNEGLQIQGASSQVILLALSPGNQSQA